MWRGSFRGCPPKSLHARPKDACKRKSLSHLRAIVTVLESRDLLQRWKIFHLQDTRAPRPLQSECHRMKFWRGRTILEEFSPRKAGAFGQRQGIPMTEQSFRSP